MPDDTKLTHERLQREAIKADMRGEVQRNPSINMLGRAPHWRSVPGSVFGNVAGIAMRESSSGPLLKLSQVCARLRVSRFTLWRMVKRGEFPAAVDIGKRRAVWRGEDVNAWCKAHSDHFERVLARKLPAALYR